MAAPLTIALLLLAGLVTLLAVALPAGLLWLVVRHTRSVQDAEPETFAARLVSKRTSRVRRGGSRYHATFEREDGGGRVEVRIAGADVGQLDDGDEGEVTIQGGLLVRFDGPRGEVESAMPSAFATGQRIGILILGITLASTAIVVLIVFVVLAFALAAAMAA